MKLLFFYCCLAAATLAAAVTAQPERIVEVIPDIHLRDQFGAEHHIRFPRTNALILTVADHKGSKQMDTWTKPLQKRYGSEVAIEGLADLGKVPGFLRGRVEKGFRRDFPRPLLLDWSGNVAKLLQCEKDAANVFVVDASGRILAHAAGRASPEALTKVFAAADRATGVAR